MVKDSFENNEIRQIRGWLISYFELYPVDKMHCVISIISSF